MSEASPVAPDDSSTAGALSSSSGGPATAPKPARAFPIVGVGASAGGLLATTLLLRHLSPQPGVALVIVHHLDPTHESSLAELFARETAMPVQSITAPVRVEANRVYVVPPNAGVEIRDGVLRPTPRLAASGLHLPIDAFFASLAADREELAVGVVLSGTGSDGTEGVRAIRAKGGIVLAQDDSAQYRDMPQHAVATGCVDFVRPPHEIARELERIGADPGLDFERVLVAMTRASGVDFARYKQSTIRRRMERRIAAQRLSGMREYAELVSSDPKELAILCEQVLIHVTQFFRDPEAFAALQTLVFPRLLQGRPSDAPIRVWVPGCASGEEVYSLAMSLLEALDEAGLGQIPLKIFGTDVSPESIERARVGVYPDTIEQHVSQGRLQRFFSRSSAGYQIRKDVRDLCVFAQHDTTRDPPFSNMDLISCRNLMIYLGPALQERVLPLFHYALRDPGFLLLGQSETARSFPGFAVLDEKNKIYTRNPSAPRYPLDFTGARFGEPVPLLPGAKLTSPVDVSREADRLVLAEYAPVGVVVSEDLGIVQFRGKTGAYLEPSPGAASLDLFRMARESIRVPLRQALDEARTTQTPVKKGLFHRVDGAPSRPFELNVIPFTASTRQRYFLILFKEQPLPAVEPLAGSAEAAPPEGPSPTESQLRQELDATRAYLQSVIEQLEAGNEELKAANEEIVSSNEELRSTNEELQTAKEELQATNEELRTVNEEMSERNVRAGRVNDDLKNVLNSIDVPVVLLSRDARIRRFTPAATKVFRVVATDVGRPIVDIKAVIDIPELPDLLEQSLESLSVVTRTVRDREGRWYQIVVRPYLTEDNRIDGTVMLALDIDASKKAEERLLEANELARGVIDTVGECLVVLDGSMVVRAVNQPFLETFGLTGPQMLDQPLSSAGQGEWGTGPLKSLVDDVAKGIALDERRLEHTFRGAGWRVFAARSRKIEPTNLVLLALRDITADERSKAALQRQEIAFRDVLTAAAEGVLMFDEAGKIVFANEMATKMFGFDAEEMCGLTGESLVPERMRSEHALARAAFVDARRQGPMATDRDVRGLRKDGSEFPAAVTLGCVARDGGVHLVAFVTDVSDRRAAEEKIKNYQRKLQQMAFDAALAEERERRRIAVDLHDRIGQSLALVQIKLSSLRDTLSDVPRAALDQAVDLVAQSVTDTRSLTFELSPPVLYDLGLAEALSWLAEDLEKRYGVRIDVEHAGDLHVDDVTAGLLFRSAREVLMNVLKHAHTSEAQVTVRRDDDTIELDVVDHGVGFDPSAATFWAGHAGFGLFSVREQVNRLGGSLVLSSSPGKGTRVVMRVPARLQLGEKQ